MRCSSLPRKPTREIYLHVTECTYYIRILWKIVIITASPLNIHHTCTSIHSTKVLKKNYPRRQVIKFTSRHIIYKYQEKKMEAKQGDFMKILWLPGSFLKAWEFVLSSSLKFKSQNYTVFIQVRIIIHTGREITI